MEDWGKTRYMENKMLMLGKKNCSYWGTYLYGKQGEGPAMITHLDGRNYEIQNDIPSSKYL